MVFTSCAFAQAAHPDFLLLQQNHRIILVGPPQQSTFEMACSDPIFDWEGHSSTARFSSSAEGVIAEFKLDIIGPDWLFVSMVEGESGLTLTLRRTNGDGTENQFVDNHSYADYSALESDARYGTFMASLLRRCGQNPRLPDVDCVRTIVFGVAPAVDPLADHECAQCVARLNDSNWQVRNEATRRLSEPGLVQHLPAVVAEMSLSPEQRARVDAILRQYQLDLQESLLGPLVMVEFPQGDVALASD